MGQFLVIWANLEFTGPAIRLYTKSRWSSSAKTHITTTTKHTVSHFQLVLQHRHPRLLPTFILELKTIIHHSKSPRTKADFLPHGQSVECCFLTPV